MLVQRTGVFCGNTSRLICAIDEMSILKCEQLRAKAQDADLLEDGGSDF